MPARRSLRLEGDTKNEKSSDNARRNPSSYSPLTGTRRMSPSSALKRPAAGARERAKPIDANTGHAEPETSSRGQTAPEENAEILELFSEVEGSLKEFLTMRQRLTDLQAVGGSRELGNLVGKDSGELDLKTEIQKTKVLICEVRKRKKRQRTG
ncbi:centromere protein R isoform X2 [Rhinoderma darwinii]|uniref:centromere protein R isoform X2 n=1 Tax=Rhinoderma darwinii TaxID=43563 RepID=UPI003F6774E8